MTPDHPLIDLIPRSSRQRVGDGDQAHLDAVDIDGGPIAWPENLARAVGAGGGGHEYLDLTFDQADDLVGWDARPPVHKLTAFLLGPWRGKCPRPRRGTRYLRGPHGGSDSLDAILERPKSRVQARQSREFARVSHREPTSPRQNSSDGLAGCINRDDMRWFRSQLPHQPTIDQFNSSSLASVSSSLPSLLFVTSGESAAWSVR
jgi:hypothetical protein